MDCPYKPACANSCKGVCANTLTDVAIMVGGMQIPGFMQHLIQRPLHHMVLMGGPNTLEGALIMEFNGQIFREDIRVSRSHKCSECHQFVDAKDAYSQAVERGTKKIARNVNIVVKQLLTDALRRFDV